MISENSPQLRDLQQVELQILSAFHDFCINNHLRYYLSSGTLLGAVRHKGFIPWDDDVDVCMPYEDYKVFCEKAQGQMGDRFFIQTCMTDRNYYSPYAKIRLNNTTCLEKYYTKYDIHHGVWIDVFPIVEVNDGADYRIKKLILKASSVLQIENHMLGQPEDFKKNIGAGGILAVRLISKIPMKVRQRLHHWILDRLFSAKGKTKRVEVFASFFNDPVLPPVYGTPVSVQFEGNEFNAPQDWDTYLTVLYGDYMQMPPEEDRVNHLGNDGVLDLKNSYELYMETN